MFGKKRPEPASPSPLPRKGLRVTIETADPEILADGGHARSTLEGSGTITLVQRNDNSGATVFFRGKLAMEHAVVSFLRDCKAMEPDLDLFKCALLARAMEALEGGAEQEREDEAKARADGGEGK